MNSPLHPPAASCQEASPATGGEEQEAGQSQDVFISIQAFPALLDITESCDVAVVSCGSRHTAAVTGKTAHSVHKLGLSNVSRPFRVYSLPRIGTLCHPLLSLTIPDRRKCFFVLSFTFMVFNRRFYQKRHTINTCQKIEKQHSIAVGTVRMLIEPSAKH